ncbi:MAG TPA: carbohydrate ABC transporter permease, partial [Asanoa sp.]|nr:carbohydrate ABC transporter permease [Asanoa sp.]
MTTIDRGVRGRDRIAKAVLYAILSVGLLVVVGPFVWMALSSLKPEGEIRSVPPTWLPETWTLDNFRDLFSRLDFPLYFFNSALVAVAVTAGNLLFCSLVGYALAKLHYPGKRVLFLAVLGMLMVPGMVTFVPQFVLVSNMGLTNSYAGLILPFLVGPFGVFLMRQFLQSIPDDLIEAARVDGAGEMRIFWRIVLPLCRPALATLGILTFLASWNNFLWPLVVASTEDKYTLPVALALYSIG